MYRGSVARGTENLRESNAFLWDQGFKFIRARVVARATRSLSPLVRVRSYLRGVTGAAAPSGNVFAIRDRKKRARISKRA